MAGPDKEEVQGILNDPYFKMDRPDKYNFKGILNNNGALDKKYAMQSAAPIRQQESYMPQLRQDLSKADPYMNAMGERALSTGPSQWAQMQEQKQRLSQQGRVEDLTGAMSSERATAEAALAQRGGLSQGARERLMKDAMMNNALGRQKISGEGEITRLGIGAEDDLRKMELMKQIPSLYGQQAELLGGFAGQEAGRDLNRQQFNTNLQQQANAANQQAAIAGVGAQEAAAQNMYNQDMSAWAAMKAANADYRINS